MRPLIFFLAAVCCLLVLVAPAGAGPYQTFVYDPTPYWVNDSVGGVALTHDSDLETVNVTGSEVASGSSITSFAETTADDVPFFPDGSDYASGGSLADSFADVSDWSGYATEAGDAVTSDGDLATFTFNDDGNADYFQATWAPGVITGHYVEWRMKYNTTAGGTVGGFGLLKGGLLGAGGSTAQAFTLGAVTTLTTTKNLMTATDSITGMYVYCANPTGTTDLAFYFDYLRVAPETEQGWQHDCSAVDNTTGLSSDGDKIALGGIDPITTTEFYADYAGAAEACIDPDYYPFLEFSVSGAPVAYTVRVQEADDGWVSVFGSSITTGVRRANIRALTAEDIRVVEFDLGSGGFLDWVKMYGIAGWTVTQSGCSGSDYLYVSGSVVVSEKSTTGSITVDRDAALSVAVAIYSVWNVTTTWVDMGAVTWKVNFKVNGVNEEHIDETRGGFINSPTLTDVWVRFYYDQTVSGIKFLQLPDLSIAIPVLAQEYQTVNLGLEVANLVGEIAITPHRNGTSSGWTTYINATHITTMGGLEWAIDGMASVQLMIDDLLRTMRVYVTHFNKSFVGSENYDYGRHGNGFVNLTLTHSGLYPFGTFVFWYVTGDTDYSSIYNYARVAPVWTVTGTEDSDVEQGLTQALQIDNAVVSHDVNVSASIYLLQYERTWMDLEYEFLGYGGTDDVDVTFAQTWEIYCSNGTQSYEVAFIQTLELDNDSDVQELRREYYVRQYSGGTYTTLKGESRSASVSYQTGQRGYTFGKIGIWRTQENHLGVLWWGNFSIYGEGAGFDTTAGGSLWSAWGSPTDRDVESSWISLEAVELFNVTSTKTYRITCDNTFTSSFLLLDMAADEYQYGLDYGVAQPHFSSTYWDNPVWGEFGGGHAVVDPDSYGGDDPDPQPNPLLDPLGWIAWSIRNAINALGAIITGFFAGLGTAVVSGFGGWLMSVISSVPNLFGVIWDGIFGGGAASNIWSSLQSLYSLFANVFVVLGNLWGIIGSIISVVVTWAGWVVTNIVRYQEFIFWLLIALPMWGYVNDGVEGAWKYIGAYLRIVKGIMQFVIDLFLAIVNTIGNFIPLT